MRSYAVARVADEIVADLLGQACGIGYAAAASGGIELRDVLGVPVPVAGKPLLIRRKEKVRVSDRADVRFLKLRLEEESR